jgi:hypothetical protein
LVSKEEKSERIRRWKEQNPERVREYTRKYARTHRDKINADQREWTKKHPGYRKSLFYVNCKRIDCDFIEQQLEKFRNDKLKGIDGT